MNSGPENPRFRSLHSGFLGWGNGSRAWETLPDFEIPYHEGRSIHSGVPETYSEPPTSDSGSNGVRAFANIASDHEERKGDAIVDTSQRDTTYDALRAYMKELKGVAKGALRGKHDLLAKLGL